MRFVCFAAMLLAATGCDDDDGNPTTTGVGSGSGGAGADGGAGSGGGGGVGGDGGALVVCPAQHDAVTGDGHAVVVCDEAYPDAPYVHLPASAPADGAPTSTIAFAWLDGTDFVTTEGERFASGFEMAELTSESVRFAFAFYRVELDPSLEVADWVPRVLVDEGVLLAALAGRAAEGSISRRVAAGEFELERTLPIRVELGAIEPAADGTTPQLPPGMRKRLRIDIANLDDGAAAADGACLPALASYGAEDPFFGLDTAAILATVVPSMHVVGMGDDHLVLEYELDGAQSGSLMGGWFPRVERLLTGEPMFTGSYQGSPHGTPTSMPGLDLDLVRGGGEPCN